MESETPTNPDSTVDLVGVLGAWWGGRFGCYSRPVQSIKALALSPNPDARSFSMDPDYMAEGRTSRWAGESYSTGDLASIAESRWLRRFNTASER